MASLTHVCVWSSKGWTHITPEEVARSHPGGSVSARSGLFMCELCGQYVRFVDGDIQTPHFRHSAYEESKDCPERTFGPGGNYTYVAGEHELPIRIVNITSTGFSFELGLVAVPRELLKKQMRKELTIVPSNKSMTPFVYSYERLNKDVLTYVPIGDCPSEKYTVISSDEIERTYWPRITNGVRESGAIFDAESGKMLPDDADVIVGKEYYLLSRGRLYNIYNGVSIRQLLKRNISWSTWYLLQVTATDLTESAAKFFLNYHCRLTSQPISIQPIWPVYVQSPYVIQNSGETTWFLVQGQGETTTKTYPAATMLYYPSDGGKVCSIEVNERQQLISTGRAKVLEYTYLWKKPLNERAEQPKVTISDIDGNPVPSGLQNNIPQNHIIRVTAPFDGTIRLEKNGFVIEQISLKAEISIELDAIQYGVRVLILQGLDIVWSAEYKKENSEVLSSDDTVNFQNLVHAHGRKIPVSHTLGATVGLLKNYPKTRKWGSEKIRSGYMEEDALAYYKNFIVMLKSKR